MPYIYQIVNDINDKVYVGKTNFPLEKRFKEHCKDVFKRDFEKRPLYSAMKKYGVEHFHIELLEETDNPEEREKYWIEQKHSYENGYNATRGGDGKPYLDYDLIVSTYQRLQNIVKTAKEIGCDRKTVSNILKANNIEILSSQEITRNKTSKPINQYDLDNNFIQTFPSTTAAARALNKEKGACHLADCAKHRRKTAYGFIWRYVE